MSSPHRSMAVLALDYEIFFGRNCGTIENCMIRPTNALVKMLDKYSAKLSLFVDAAFLIALRQASSQNKELVSEYDKIAKQLRDLTSAGHDIQLHIHPHWLDSVYNNGWQIDTSRYRLHDFSGEKRASIVRDCKEELTEHSDSPIFAYRAGGWCLQPFPEIKSQLLENDIWLDSTVYAGGLSEEQGRHYDFRGAEESALWRFESDPLVSDPTGTFIELPISSVSLSPFFYWKLALAKSTPQPTFGDGTSMKANLGYYLTRLLMRTRGPVSIDGKKADTLQIALEQSTAAKHQYFNIMGHPKSISQQSIDTFEKFIRRNPQLEFVTFQHFYNQRPKTKRL